jgi:type I restriction enzyme S subunit
MIVNIGSVGKIVTGKTPPTVNPVFYGSDYPFITPSDIPGDTRYVQTQRYLSPEGKDYQQSLLLPIGTINIVCIGATIGKICLTSRPSFTNQQINSIIVDPSKYNNLYIYYLLTQYAEILKARAGGVATPILNKSSFSEIQLELPALKIQKKIASILSAYDDLIENNTRRIAILEEMARHIYREWFVHFRFPGHENVKLVDSPLGKIPQGWEVKKLGDVFEILGGGTPSTKNDEYWMDGTINWYTPTDLTSSNSMFSFESKNKITNEGLKHSSSRLFPEYSVMMTSRATIGVVSINVSQACTNQGFIVCIPNDRVGKYFIYSWINENKGNIIQVASGATFKEISKSTFKTLSIIVPLTTVSSRFEQLIHPMGELINNLTRQVKSLRDSRDLLLPRLISGELDVSEMEGVG